MKRFIPYSLFVFLSLILQIPRLHAQETDTRYTTHALSMGIGLTNVLESYLSPLEYTGMEMRLQKENFRKTTFREGKIYVQTLLNVHASFTNNPAGNADMYEGLLNWNLSYLYLFSRTEKLKLLMGPTLELNGGVLYNERNSNNPAQAKASACLGITCMTCYPFRLLHKDFQLRYELSLPLVGLMFSPEYGESYYEMFQLKHSGHHICFRSPIQSPSLRQTLSVDFPMKQTILRVSYAGDIQQDKVNNLKSHVWSHAFLVGIVKNFRIVKPRDNEFKKTPLAL